VHARFFIQHIHPHEQAVIRRMVELLKPGGWLMIEDLDAATMPARPDHPLSAAYNQATAGSRPGNSADVGGRPPGRALPSRFQKAGLINIRQDGRIYVENGGSLMARFFVESLKVSRQQFDEKGFGPVIDLNIQALSDPTFCSRAAPSLRVGQKPGEAVLEISGPAPYYCNSKSGCFTFRPART